ncbi:MAG TPA: hypothetical protein VIK01_27585 [Polyangiaceae bacterium]
MAAFALSVTSTAVASEPPAVAPHGRARKICQLTGDSDASDPTQPTSSLTATRAKLAGTDLGASFRGPLGTIYFLFGDSEPVPEYTPPPAADAIAWARQDDDPRDCIDLTFFRTAGAYQPPTVPGIGLGIFGVPTGGFFANGASYVVFTRGSSRCRPGARTKSC